MLAERPLTAILLAAGRSTRMGESNKLLLAYGGRTMVECVAHALRAGGCEDVVAVLGHQREAVAQALAGFRFQIVFNPHYATGLATSIRAGVEGAGESVTGYLFALGDMPGLKAETVAALRAAYTNADEDAIIMPTTQGRRGHPVVFSAAYRQELQELSGDAGARALLGKYSSCVVELDAEDDGILLDVDTPQAYQDSDIDSA